MGAIDSRLEETDSEVQVEYLQIARESGLIEEWETCSLNLLRISSQKSKQTSETYSYREIIPNLNERKRIKIQLQLPTKSNT